MPTSLVTGMVVALFVHELFGLSPGGLLAPGYLAFYLFAPAQLLLIALSALTVLLILRWADKHMLLYGRRRYSLAVLAGALIIQISASGPWFGRPLAGHTIALIIPGLMALDIEGQGVKRTVGSLVATVLVVRLFLELWQRVRLP